MVNPFFQQIINHKIKNINVNELMEYAHQYRISITESDAQKIVAIIQAHPINIFNQQERRKLMVIISKKVNPEIAKNINKLIESMIH
jgi:hypothetical protein